MKLRSALRWWAADPSTEVTRVGAPAGAPPAVQRAVNEALHANGEFCAPRALAAHDERLVTLMEPEIMEVTDDRLTRLRAIDFDVEPELDRETIYEDVGEYAVDVCDQLSVDEALSQVVEYNAQDALCHVTVRKTEGLDELLKILASDNVVIFQYEDVRYALEIYPYGHTFAIRAQYSRMLTSNGWTPWHHCFIVVTQDIRFGSIPVVLGVARTYIAAVFAGRKMYRVVCGDCVASHTTTP